MQKVAGFDADRCLHNFVIKHIKEAGPAQAKTVVKGQHFELMDTEFSIVSVVMQRSWDGHAMTDSERRDLKEAMRSAKGRAACFAWMNRHRANGAYEFRGLETTGEVLNILLDEAQTAGDIENLCLCIVLSQTFYDSSHTFLQSKINKHLIWQDCTFWDAAFAFKVQSDMGQFAQYCIGDGAAEDDKQDKLKSVLFAQCTTFMTMMSSFDIEESVIAGFVAQQCEKYSLSRLEQDALLSALSVADVA